MHIDNILKHGWEIKSETKGQNSLIFGICSSFNISGIMQGWIAKLCKMQSFRIGLHSIMSWNLNWNGFPWQDVELQWQEKGIKSKAILKILSFNRNNVLNLYLDRISTFWKIFPTLSTCRMSNVSISTSILREMTNGHLMQFVIMILKSFQIFSNNGNSKSSSDHEM